MWEGLLGQGVGGATAQGVEELPQFYSFLDAAHVLVTQ